jgi:hypothetical protein
MFSGVIASLDSDNTGWAGMERIDPDFILPEVLELDLRSWLSTTLDFVPSIASSTLDNRGALGIARLGVRDLTFDGDSAQIDNCEPLADLLGVEGRPSCDVEEDGARY